MAREVWQAYDCPLSGIDFDLTGDGMVHKGQRFHCTGCGQEHTAGVDVEVETFEDAGGATYFPDTPATAEDLRRLRDGAGSPWWGTGEGLEAAFGPFTDFPSNEAAAQHLLDRMRG